MTRRSLACRSLLLLCVIVAPLSLVGCGSSSSSSGPVTRDTTVMVYIIGSDLVGSPGEPEGALANIAEMMSVGSTDNMNVVIQTGGSKQAPTTQAANTNSMQPSDIDWRNVQRYQVNKNSLQLVLDLGKEKNPSDPAVDMGNAQTFGDFLAWGAKDYPAKKYIVILWDHGGGVNGGFGPDDNTKSLFSVANISQTLKDAAGKGMSLEIVGYDACLMASAEVATSLYQVANYMVASQDVENSRSWAYVPFLTYVTENPGVGGKEIGIKIVDTYVAKLTAAGFDTLTLSVIDLSKAKELVDKTDAFSAKLAPYAVRQDGWNQIAQARARSLDWYTNAMAGQDDDLVDMHTFVFKVVDYINKSIAPDEALTGAGIALGTAIESAVAYNKATGSNYTATGLTLYFPASLAAYPYTDYAVTTTSVSGSPFFASRYTNATDGLVKSYYTFYKNNTPALEATVTMNGTPADPLAATINNDFYNVIAANQASSCKVYDKNGAVVTPAPPCFYAMQAVQDFTIIPGGKWQVTFSNAAEWPHLTDGAGHSFPVAMIPDQLPGYKIGVYNEYLVPVFADGDLGYLLVEEQIPLVPGSRAFKINGFQVAKAKTPPGKYEPLKDGEIYAVAAYVWNGTSRYEFLRTDREVTVSGGTLTISGKAISGGDFGYFVTDLTGKIQTSNVLVPYSSVP